MWAVPYRTSVRDGPLLILTPMLTITEALFDQIVAHARQDHPDEACGVVAGPAGTGRPERFIPMLNAARSPTFYEFDSGDLLKLYREMDDRDEEPVVIYHSHTANAGPFQFRSYRIVDGEVTEEEVKVVESY